MKIIQYVKAFGNKKFSELPFNEVDALIFAELAYVNFDLAIGEYEFKKLKNLKIENKKKFYEGSVDSFFNRQLVELMIKSVRYRNVKIGYCRQMVDRKKALQFFAMTLIMPDHRGYIAYRGTDTSLNGWKEDMLLAFQNHMPGQEKAVEYIKTATTLFTGNFFVGGHSKGGNLAIWATLNMGEELEPRLVQAYSFDGPGFRKDITKMKSFERLQSRMTKFLTTHDMIGVVYNNAPNPKIVYSDGILLGGHDPFFWSVNRRDHTFLYTKDRSILSKGSEEALMNWLKKESDESKKLAVHVIFDLFGECKTVYDLLLNGFRLLFNSKKVIEGYSEEDRENAKQIFKQLGKYFLSAYNPRKFIKQKKETPKNTELIEEKE